MQSSPIIRKLEAIVEDACKKDTNIFGYGIWTHHIVFVVKYGTLLAEFLPGGKGDDTG